MLTGLWDLPAFGDTCPISIPLRHVFMPSRSFTADSVDPSGIAEITLTFQEGFALCKERRQLTETFATTARLYAEAAAKFGTRTSLQPDFTMLFEEAEEALRKAEAAYAELKNHMLDHHCGGIEVPSAKRTARTLSSSTAE